MIYGRRTDINDTVYLHVVMEDWLDDDGKTRSHGVLSACCGEHRYIKITDNCIPDDHWKREVDARLRDWDDDADPDKFQDYRCCYYILALDGRWLA